MRSTPTNKRAVSLGEILIGVAILATIFLALISVFPTAYSAADQSGDVIAASHLGQACMDREMTRSYSQLTNSTLNETLEGSAEGASLPRSYSVSVLVNGDPKKDDRLRINVQVLWWQRSQDLPRELRLESTRVRP